MDVGYIADIVQIITAVPVLGGTIYVGWRFIKRVKIKVELAPDERESTN